MRYRSNFESTVGQLLAEIGKSAMYEPKDCKLEYTIPASKHKYLPDFILSDGVVLECKGYMTLADRKKMKLLREQYPDLRIIMVLQAPNNPIRKGSKTTYAKWCEQNNIEWCSLSNLKDTLRK